jgi:hypothetical protein
MSRPCDAAVADGRLRKANEFFEAAEVVGDLADEEVEVRNAVVTLLVHAGIAAADVVCCRVLGEYAIGSENHQEAIGLLEKVRQPDGKVLAKRLRQLLAVKTKAGYTDRSVTAEERKRAQRAAEELVAAARAV